MFREIHEIREEEAINDNQNSIAYKQIKPEADVDDIDAFWANEFAKAAEEMA